MPMELYCVDLDYRSVSVDNEPPLQVTLGRGWGQQLFMQAGGPQRFLGLCLDLHPGRVRRSCRRLSEFGLVSLLLACVAQP